MCLEISDQIRQEIYLYRNYNSIVPETDEIFHPNSGQHALGKWRSGR